VADRLVTLHDGRRLGLTAFGDPAVERVVVLCHPAPGASGFDPDPEVTSGWGVHVVSVDRPGYGASSPLPDARRPTIGGWADDLAEYIELVIQQARETGRTPLHRIGVVGWSAGGRVALALAARHPGLVDRVAVVATPAPDSEVPWIPPEYAAADAELLAMPVAEAKHRLRDMLQRQVAGGAGVAALAQGDADLALLDRPGLRGRLERMLQHAYDQGATGVADDLLSSAGDDWGFDLDEVRAPTLLVYGAKDPIVSSEHGRWYRSRLRNASPHLTVLPRAGHLVIAPGWPRILQHVDPQHGSRSDA
jgi:pimeloyl-ACP methyl ester carboxylesterase